MMFRWFLYCLFVVLVGLLIGCWIQAGIRKDRDSHVCKPVKVVHETSTITKHDTIIIIDTLVIIERTKLVPYPARRINYISSWSLETQPYELFKNGKTRDTILRESMEHY